MYFRHTKKIDWVKIKDKLFKSNDKNKNYKESWMILYFI